MTQGTLPRRAFLLVSAAACLGDSGRPWAQEVRLGTDTRNRRLSFETLAGRRVTLADGRVFTYRRDGTFVFLDRRGRSHPGRWTIAYGNAIDLAYDDGDTEQIYYLTIEGKLYFKRSGRPGRRGLNAEQRQVVSIEAVR